MQETLLPRRHGYDCSVPSDNQILWLDRVHHIQGDNSYFFNLFGMEIYGFLLVGGVYSASVSGVALVTCSGYKASTPSMWNWT